MDLSQNLICQSMDWFSFSMALMLGCSSSCWRARLDVGSGTVASFAQMLALRLSFSVEMRHGKRPNWRVPDACSGWITACGMFAGRIHGDTTRKSHSGGLYY